jgi:GTP-binding protein
LRKELHQYDPKLAERPELVVLSQADRTEVREAYPELKEAFKERFGVDLLLVSAASRFQLDDLLQDIARRLPPRTALPPEVTRPEPEEAKPEGAIRPDAEADPMNRQDAEDEPMNRQDAEDAT